jgi:hypothetical protein
MKWVSEIPSERALQSLRSGLGLMKSGCTEDFTTRLLPRGPRGEINPFRGVVSEHFRNSTECDLHPALASAELHQLGKHGTYSRRPPYLTPDDFGLSLDVLVRRYFEPHHCVMHSGPALAAADAAVSRLYDVRKGVLTPWSLRRAAESFLQAKTGLGWPVFSSSHEHVPDVMAMSANLIRCNYPRESVHYYPGVVGFRGQPRGDGPFCKFRAIYQGSRVIGNLEKMIQGPLLNALRGCETFCAWDGRDAVDAAVTRLLRSSKVPLLSIDFSNFDSSIPEPVIRRVFRLMAGWFDRSWHPHIAYLCDAFCGCGIFTPVGFLEGEARCGGIPSGSVLTNLIGSLVNLWVVTYATTLCNGHVQDALVQGDDGVYRLVGANHAKVAKILLSEFGMTLSSDKKHVSSRVVHFLQNVFSLDYVRRGLCVGVRPLMRVLNGMMSYEDVNRKWDKSFDCLRWIQQLENASDHPAFNQACVWLLDKDSVTMEETVTKLLSNDRGLLEGARGALCGKYEWGKIAVDGIGASRTFQAITSLLASKG